MAEWNVPYRFNVYGVGFDVTFVYEIAPLEYGNTRLQVISLVFARKVGSVETVAAKSIKNPQDEGNYIQGQRVAFKRTMKAVWLWFVDHSTNKVTERDFIAKARSIAYMAGMWNTDEE